MPKKYAKPKPKKKQQREWPAVVYLWMLGFGLVAYAVVEIAKRDAWPHPIHWLAGIIGAIVGIGIGFIWYRWRDDVF